MVRWLADSFTICVLGHYLPFLSCPFAVNKYVLFFVPFVSFVAKPLRPYDHFKVRTFYTPEFLVQHWDTLVWCY